ncbi:MAG: ABC transporter ATP-binding protein [Lachnospiraceae bacterium]
MIEVRHLSKRYGTHLAVDDLSFSIDRGVVYGFLGPNGAGKSTTMNIMTGCLGATEGEVLIDGHNVAEEPMEAKKHIGYLPELPPLYGDMTPEEYLHFVARAKGLRREESARQIETVMEKTRIADVRKRLIRNLSKGYRQRVGIAQALLGNPEVIILDEPTVGLDPAQIIEIRELIRELGKEHTLVLSSHILSEVQAVCDSILILSKGRLVACDTAENLTKLMRGRENLRLLTRAEEETVRPIVENVDGVESLAFAEEDGLTAVDVTPVEGQDVREALFNAFAEAKVPLLELRTEKASLEDVFLELTGGEAQPEAVSASKETEAPAEAPEEKAGEES